MDEDVAFGIFFVIFLLVVLTLPLSITACVAASATRKWSKEKTHRVQSGIALEESDFLVSDADSDNDPDDCLDSEDEEYYSARREQKRREQEEKITDQQLSTREKFFKEWKKCWRGPPGTKEQLTRERELKETEERRKIAREAVREYLRMERRKERKARQEQVAKKQRDEATGLPTYGNAISEGKH
jgi:signal transduction histidine kinase